MSNNHRLIFWGSPDFAVPSLRRLADMGIVAAVVTKADKPQGRGQHLEASPVKTVAESLNLPVLTPTTLNQEFIDELKKFLPATFLVVAYGKIIPQTILDLSSKPALNIHPSLLPQYRGPSPLQTAIFHGDSKTGITLIQLDAEMDHGPIVAQIEVSLEPDYYFSDLHDLLAARSAELLADNIIAYCDDQMQPRAQNHEQATFCKLLSKEDGLIDWNQPAQTIYNQIRAFTPWPSAYFLWQNKRFIITRAQIRHASDRKPGTWWNENSNLYVSCGQEALHIIEIQPEGKKKMNSTEFINGYRKILSID